MNNDLILITGAVANSKENNIKVYEEIIKICQNKSNNIFSPLDTIKFVGTNEERYERAMNLLKQAYLIIAEMSTPSTGQGMELQEAVNLNIPIIVVAKTGSEISGLLLGTNNIKTIIYYDNVNILKNKLECALNE